MKEPSEKQQRAAKIIACIMDIPLPAEFTARCYWKYISEHMQESKEASARRKRFAHKWHTSKTQAEARKDKWHQQREADWEALHVTAGWAQKILDGKTIPPSWSGESLPEAQRRLRSLGFKSSMEEELERLREERFEQYGEEYWPGS